MILPRRIGKSGLLVVIRTVVERPPLQEHEDSPSLPLNQAERPCFL